MAQRQFLSEADIERAGEKFLDLSLPKPEWTHAAHFAVTLWLIRHRPSLDLDQNLPDLIWAFNEATGTANTDSGGYHETITRAALAAAGLILRRARRTRSTKSWRASLLRHWARPAGSWNIGAARGCFPWQPGAPGCLPI